MLLSACDVDRYRLLGCEEYHDNCADNLRMALTEINLEPPELPSPWNVFENVVVGEDGRLEIQPPPVKVGDFLVLLAEMDVMVVFSACPMDIVLTNRPDRTPRDVHCLIL